jgi:hypothetical protein
MSFIDEGTPYAVKVARTVWTGEKTEIISNSYLSVSINPDFIETVNYVTNFQREMRKVEAMTVLATQSPQEMVPENMSSDNFSKLKKVFEFFSSTNIFMRMDESILRHIEGLVGKSMTNSELESIPQQNQGDAVINFGSKETIRVHFSPNKRQLKLFDGGK